VLQQLFTALVGIYGRLRPALKSLSHPPREKAAKLLERVEGSQWDTSFCPATVTIPAGRLSGYWITIRAKLCA
jgi:hypothetical protein